MADVWLARYYSHLYDFKDYPMEKISYKREPVMRCFFSSLYYCENFIKPDNAVRLWKTDCTIFFRKMKKTCKNTNQMIFYVFSSIEKNQTCFDISNIYFNIYFKLFWINKDINVKYLAPNKESFFSKISYQVERNSYI